MTADDIRTELASLDTAEAAARSAFDFDLSTGTGGGKLSVRGVSQKLAYFQQRRLQLRQQLFVLEGGEGFAQARSGIDVERATDNGDGL